MFVDRDSPRFTSGREELRLIRALSVVAGGCTLEAAECARGEFVPMLTASGRVPA